MAWQRTDTSRLPGRPRCTRSSSQEFPPRPRRPTSHILLAPGSSRAPGISPIDESTKKTHTKKQGREHENKKRNAKSDGPLLHPSSILGISSLNILRSSHPACWGIVVTILREKLRVSKSRRLTTNSNSVGVFHSPYFI